ncbi:hypothetical protein N7520_004627 [Penicillium odoratum]|uniref:uncharacterized protein n=1 Tax=Penicillium odoratum TaxID=1167516 RepID=UPI002547D2E9|nr:uncharacterized protein N7520_004627 [Penicillium odoratum]KAJ5765068.1 hypothetical protein N7520_004627 [Penicillium odoratum]
MAPTNKNQITDSLGKLQYIPFVTCNETSRPLSIRYGISETINCTIPVLSDTLYHLFEFYVHSDVPMTCRVPTSPLSSPNRLDKTDSTPESGETDAFTALSENGPPFTPLTIALQGTLQLSHLHIWSDMNMLMHDIPSDAAAQPEGSSGTQSGQPGYVIAGTAYSTPEFEAAVKNVKLDEDEEAVAVSQAAREPWTLGHGTKVIRGEPLTFSFHVAWLEGGAGIGWPERSKTESFLGVSGTTASRRSGSSSLLSRLFFIIMAGSVGALIGLYWERNGQSFRRRAGWKGEGILGASSTRGVGSSVTFGNGGRIHGYGGYSASATGGANGNGNGAGYGGYGGFPTGKRD